MTMAAVRRARRGEGGFTLIEAVIVLAITLLLGLAVYRITRASWNLYNTQTHHAERAMTGLRALDDMAVEIARAGYGLGADAAPLFPGTLDGRRTSDAITLRSNPGGIAGLLQETLEDPDRLTLVDGAPLFAVGDEVLLVDEDGRLERAQVTKTAPDALAFRSTYGEGGRFQVPWLADTRVLKVREVGFFLETDATGTVVLARKATGQAKQIIARFVGELGFEYFDDLSGGMDPRRIGPGQPPGGVLIHLALRRNPNMPPITVPPLTLRVSLEPQSAIVAFDTYAFRRIGVAGIVGQDPASAGMKVGMHGWRKSEPLF